LIAAMNAEIIAVGSELLTPDRLDTNSLYLTRRLNQLGIAVSRKTIVGDEHERLRDAFRGALDRAALVISTGGLGPTLDDVTREAVADLLRRRLLLNEDVLRRIESRFRRLGRTMSENNKRQALVPEGASVLENPVGTAPGLWLETDGRLLVLLPGPPAELQAIFAQHVESRLARLSGGLRLFSREMRVAGIGESEVDHRAAPIYSAYAGVETTVLTAPGEIQIHLRCWSSDPAASEEQLSEIVKRLTLALGESVFTATGESMEQTVGRELTRHQATIAAAESCTGGLLAERLTRVPGSSAYFRGGVVCYSNDLKTAWADVPPELIESQGAVSSAVAQALAAGIRRRTGATLGVGITGIAGPAGGSPEKPVGLVHVALADAVSGSERAAQLTGDRDRIRWQASQLALDMVRRYLLHLPPGAPGAAGGPG
jgi:competence/damage-inducible protein CinA-like protein